MPQMSNSNFSNTKPANRPHDYTTSSPVLVLAKKQSCCNDELRCHNCAAV